jgi:uncharacterized protein YbgA (DUF1722 family)/uncharacterized protein YbbK (DUF523 family)
MGQFVEYVPVCPEVEAGFGVPRESVRLVGDPENPRMITFKSKKDLTDQMKRWAKKRVKELEKEDLCGFIFKSDSPSSGMIRVKVYSEKGMPHKVGVGMFARAFMDHFPRIPVEDDGRLHNPAIRENFIERIFSLKRWRDIAAKSPRIGKLVDFHSRNKLLLLSHSQKHYRLMGKLVANGKKLTPRKLFDQYEQLLLEALALNTTAKKNNNVLQHLMGYFKKQLTADEKQELLEVFEQYRKGYAIAGAPHSDQSLCAQIRSALSQDPDLSEPASGGAQIENERLAKGVNDVLNPDPGYRRHRICRRSPYPGPA